MNKPKTIALVDGLAGGHHLTHLRNYAHALADAGHRVLELTADPGHVAQWFASHHPEMLDRIRILPFVEQPIRSPSWRLRRWWAPLIRWSRAARAVRRAAKETGFDPDLVFFCWLDDYLLDAAPAVRRVLPLVFPCRWSGVYFHPWHLRLPADGRVEESSNAEWILKARNCTGVAVLDEGIASVLEQRLGKRVAIFPDETEEQLANTPHPTAQKMKERAAGRPVIGALGSISKRKGVMTLFEVAEASRDKPWFFAVVGSLSEGSRRTFSETELQKLDAAVRGEIPNVFASFEHIEDETEFNTVFAACDMHYAVYETFAHSSGILTKAAFFEKPVIVAKGFCMEERIRRFGMGVAVEQNHVTQIVAAIERLIADAMGRAPGEAPDYAGCRREHSIERLGTAFGEILRGL